MALGCCRCGAFGPWCWSTQPQCSRLGKRRRSLGLDKRQAGLELITVEAPGGDRDIHPAGPSAGRGGQHKAVPGVRGIAAAPAPPRLGDPHVRSAAALVGVGHHELPGRLVHRRGDVSKNPVLGVGQQSRRRIKDGGDRGTGAPGVPPVGRLGGHYLVALQARLVGQVDPGVIHRAVRADVDPGVLVELVAVVADRDRTGPVLAVVIRERGLDRGAAGPVETPPRSRRSARNDAPLQCWCPP
jgi:hypothetical protein